MISHSYRYLHYDVFTDTPFEGNQLAVFPEPQGLSTEQMQTITREMNFSECTFIFPPETAGTNVRMRIFTPGEELPMAGHPTIGSTFALAHEGVIKPGQDGFVFGLGVGPTPVSLAWKGTALDFAWMTQKNPQVGGEIKDRAAFARALGLSDYDLMPSPVQVISCGVPFLFVALLTRKAVDSVIVDSKAYDEVCRAAWLDDVPLFIFTPDRTGADGDEAVYSRMLAPKFGIAEDPATGGASGPLGCYLFAHQLIERGRMSRIVSLQGVKMRRPSRIHISIDASGEQITRVRVGGRSVLVGDGRLVF
jgi:trans-2,3-dihydro-3-hydroxyanthranilate isomerase